MANATRRLLARTLEQLLETTPLDRITVKQLAEQSGVNRQTFYYNFDDIRALVAWMFEEHARRLLEGADLTEDWRTVLQRITQELLAHRALVCNTYRSLDRGHLERYLRSRVRPYIAHVAAERAQRCPVTPRQLDFICECYTAAFVGLALEWVSRDMSDDLGAQLDMFLQLVDGSMESVLQRFAVENARAGASCATPQPPVGASQEEPT